MDFLNLIQTLIKIKETKKKNLMPKIVEVVICNYNLIKK